MFDFNKYLGSDSALGKLANSYVTGLANNASKPKPLSVTVTAPASAMTSSSFDMKRWGIIGGGVLAGILLLTLVMRKGK